MMRKTLSVLLFMGALSLFGCRNRAGDQSENDQAPPPDKVLVATAANVQFAMDELTRLFEEQSGIKAEVILSSSGKLTAQIQQGAPYDLLVSADMKYPKTLYESGQAEAPPRVYALGALVLWTLGDIELSADLSFLQNPAIHKIAIANPQNAPYGEQAVRALQHYGVYDQVVSRLVYGESIAQTNQYILSRVSEVGFTAKSVVLSPEIQGKGHWVEIDPAAYSPIEQGVVITRYGEEHHPEASRRFYDFLFSQTARDILIRYGYGLPEGKGSAE